MKFHAPGRTVDAAQFDAAARRVAAQLADVGVCEGSAVGLVTINEIEVLVAHEALAYLGAYAVPIGWHSTVSEIAYIAADADLVAVIAHVPFAAVVSAAVQGHPLIWVDVPPQTREIAGLADIQPDADALMWAGWDQDAASWAGEKSPARQAVIYTSGTTGKPKGVVRDPHPDERARRRNEKNVAMVWGAQPGGRALLTAPLYHSAPLAFIRSSIRAAGKNGEIVIMPRFDAAETLRLIDQHRITSLWMVPTMFIRMLALPAEVRDSFDVASVANIVHSAAACPVGVKLAMIDWFGPVLNEFYGSTESGPVTYATSEDYLAKPGTVGRVIDDCRVEIIDADGRIAPRGTVGEIAVVNTTYADFTYKNRGSDRDQLTVEDLILSGDIGVLDEEGYLFLKDRKKDMVISGGVNLYPAEIEDVLLQLENVSDGAVFGVPDEFFGERLVAAVALREEEPDAAERLLAQLRMKLSSVKLPKQIHLLQDFPRSEAGKVSKHKLRAMFS